MKRTLKSVLPQSQCYVS